MLHLCINVFEKEKTRERERERTSARASKSRHTLWKVNLNRFRLFRSIIYLPYVPIKSLIFCSNCGNIRLHLYHLVLSHILVHTESVVMANSTCVMSQKYALRVNFYFTVVNLFSFFGFELWLNKYSRFSRLILIQKKTPTCACTLYKLPQL